jgi:outer membrane receptor for ferrienterochelin and colicins
MDVSITENNVKRKQLLTESFSGVWSISYKFNNNLTLDYTGNIFGPMRLPLLGENDTSYMYASNQGIRLFLGLRYTIF